MKNSLQTNHGILGAQFNKCWTHLKKVIIAI
jgi:hypothetical protein